MALGLQASDAFVWLGSGVDQVYWVGRCPGLPVSCQLLTSAEPSASPLATSRALGLACGCDT